MVKLLFKPIGMLGGLAAGILAKKVFAILWRAIDDREPPQAEDRRVGLARLATALALEGAVFSLARGFFDHGARRVFELMSGAWPGAKVPPTGAEPGVDEA